MSTLFQEMACRHSRQVIPWTNADFGYLWTWKIQSQISFSLKSCLCFRIIYQPQWVTPCLLYTNYMYMCMHHRVQALCSRAEFRAGMISSRRLSSRSYALLDKHRLDIVLISNDIPQFYLRNISLQLYMDHHYFQKCIGTYHVPCLCLISNMLSHKLHANSGAHLQLPMVLAFSTNRHATLIPDAIKLFLACNLLAESTSNIMFDGVKYGEIQHWSAITPWQITLCKDIWAIQ